MRRLAYCIIKSNYLGNSEKANPGQDDQSHGVEPASDIGQDPQGESKLDRVQHVLHQEEAFEFDQGSVQIGRGFVGKVVHFVLGDCQVEVCKIISCQRRGLF